MTMPTPQWAYQTPVKPSSGDTFWLWRCSHCRRLDRSHWSFSLFLVSFWHSDPFYLFLARRNSFSGRYESFYICNEAGKPQISYTLYFFKVLEPALRKRSKAVIPGLTPEPEISLDKPLQSHYRERRTKVFSLKPPCSFPEGWAISPSIQAEFSSFWGSANRTSCHGAVWLLSLVSRMLPHVINQVELRVSVKKGLAFLLYHMQASSNLYTA